MTLQEIRFYMGLTQYDIAKKTGVPQSKISLIENGYVTPKEEDKKKLAKALNCSVKELFPPMEKDNDRSNG